MLKITFFVTIFFACAFAEIIDYANSGLTEEEIIEELKKIPIVINDKPLELDLKFNQELLRSVKKKRKIAQETKKTTEKRYAAPVPE